MATCRTTTVTARSNTSTRKSDDAAEAGLAQADHDRNQASVTVARAAIGIAKPHGASAEDPVADMLFVADMLASMRGKFEELATRLQVSAPAMRLGLAGVDPEKIYAAAATEAASISKALG
ncbi:MAG: hypothetical protein EBV65_11075 [Gammaproteobacteria bacterium]|nr:hypothetical protein [Gammaproteobacteria bacterium]